MSRLIDADALKKAITQNREIDRNAVCDVLDIIDNAPTVCNDNYSMGYQDGVKKVLSERPTGEWIEKVERRGCFAGDKTVYSYTCPFCGAKEFKKYPFCHCGADMRRECCDD